ncbi:MAG: class I SAM-dependent methyltransferase [Chloroflexi bacterium]|nr:class I SAM-dependent methyltransferase [Chloroflexota bacterium]
MTSLKQALKYTFLHPRGLANRALYAALVRLAPAARGALLDLGCGRKPYADLFAPYVTRHVGLDVPVSIHGRAALDLIGSALSLPLEADSFDTVLATEVMEHVPDPGLMLAEIYRVLAPGGVLILSVPLHEPLHELPYDYYRFTPVALEYLLRGNGFTVEQVERRGGSIVVVAYLFCAFLYRVYGATGYPNALKMRPLAGPLLVTVCLFIQMVAARLDRLVEDEFDTLGYALVARKTR